MNAIKDNARELLGRLGRPIRIEEAFLALYQFVAESNGAAFGWLPLGRRAIDGNECDLLLTRWYPTFRAHLDEDTPIEVCLEIGDLSASLNSAFNTGLISPSDSKNFVLALRIIDLCFRGVHLGEVGERHDTAGSERLRTRLRGNMPLFESGALKVFPKPRRSDFHEMRGQGSLNDLLSILTVVRLPPQLNLKYLASFLSPFGRGQFERIGVIPTIHSHSELNWAAKGEGYSVRERPEVEAIVHDRVMFALEQLLNRNVDLVVMPELVSGKALNTAIEKYLGSRAAAGLSMPQIVLTGTCLVSDGGLVRNRAHAYSGRGELLWIQDKLHAYCFTALEQGDAGHPLGAKDLCDRLECISVEPRTLVVSDISGSQRIVTLTCEDFIQPEPQSQVVRDLYVTTLLVPIMSKKRDEPPAQGWITDAAMSYVRRPGATSVVANSGTLMKIAAGSALWWQFCELMSSPRLVVSWESVEKPGEDLPVAWFCSLNRKI